jgi:hypothetical protein
LGNRKTLLENRLLFGKLASWETINPPWKTGFSFGNCLPLLGKLASWETAYPSLENRPVGRESGCRPFGKYPVGAEALFTLLQYRHISGAD